MLHERSLLQRITINVNFDDNCSSSWENSTNLIITNKTNMPNQTSLVHIYLK